MDIAAWLRCLGLEHYEAAFRANEIDASLLATLIVKDLKDIRITLVGHRRLLLNAIASRPAVYAGSSHRDLLYQPWVNPLSSSGESGANSTRPF